MDELRYSQAEGVHATIGADVHCVPGAHVKQDDALTGFTYDPDGHAVHAQTQNKQYHAKRI